MPSNDQMTELYTRRDTLAAEAEEILARSANGFADADQTRFSEIETRLDDLKLYTDRVAALQRAVNGGGGIESSERTPARTVHRDGTSEVKGHALEAIERSANLAGRDAAEGMTRVLEADADSSERMATYIARSGSPEYAAAFGKWMRNPEFGHREWSGPELEAFRGVQQMSRAMSLGTNSAGGYLLPYALDPQIHLISAGVVDPMRKLATIKKTVLNEQRFVTATPGAASWDAEAAEVSDDSPTLAQPSITGFKGATYIPASYELLEDSDFESQILTLMLDEKATLEANAFTLGTGSGQPRGLITALIAAGGGSVITSAGSALAVADVQANQQALPARWRLSNPVFMANLALINQGRITQRYTNGPALVDDTTTPAKLMGWPVYENSTMDGTIAAGATADYVLVSGDFRQYVVTDRLGTSLELIPNVVGANFRPTGQRGFYMHWRTGGDALVPSAFVLTNFSG